MERELTAIGRLHDLFTFGAYARAMETAFADLIVAVDASDEAQRGIDFAIALGRKGARLHFCSVVDPALTFEASAMGGAIDTGDTIQIMEDDARSVCAAAEKRAKAGGVAADSSVRFGSVGFEIGKYAHEHHSQALVIGTHARTGVSRAMLGSVAERLMQSSDIPIVVTHRDDVAGDGPITVAIDASPAARAALVAAIDEARAQGRSLSILTVVDRSGQNWLTAEPILEDAGDLAREAGIDFELVTLDGKAVDTIVACAQRLRSPIIFIGTHGRSDLARLVLGSVAAGVVERAQVPVTVVRAAVSD
jgi:nucleotide-binding universal stress UspA family protein